VTDGAVATAKAPPRPGFRLGLGGPGLTRGLVVAYLSVMVLLPIAAVVATSLEGGIGAFWDAVTAPQAVAALKLTLIASFVVVAINAVAGTIITLLALYGDNGVLGLSGVSFTRIGVIMALLFVTLPFVIRAVQPVLLELDHAMEEAAASLGAKPFTVFRRIILPNLTPAIVAGVALAFARSMGEFGSLVLISGNIPFDTEVASVFIFGQIESGNTESAAAVSVVLLAIALVVLLIINAIGRWSTRYGH
jgi:sulfate transport system permease protein